MPGSVLKVSTARRNAVVFLYRRPFPRTPVSTQSPLRPREVRRVRHTSVLIPIHQRVLYTSIKDSLLYTVTRVDQSKTVEVRIMQLSSQSSPMTLVSSWLISPRNSKGNIGSGDAK